MKKVKAVECKFIMHKPAVKVDGRTLVPDLHFIKEKIQYEDGEYELKLRVLENYKRPYWVTQPNKRQHKQFKECEDIGNLLQFEATESDLKDDLIKKLYNVPMPTYREYRKLKECPYVYGTDINSRVFIKKKYMQAYPDAFTNYTLCTFDIETDIDTDEVLLISIAMEDRVFTTISKKFIDRIDNPIKKLNKLFEDNIPIKGYYKPEYLIVEEEIELFTKVMERVHQWKPDWLAVWNIDFDFPKMMALCEKYGVDIADIISEPSLPKEYKYCIYKRSQDANVSASGVRKNTDIQNKWNIVYAPAHFHWIDAMAAYAAKRTNTKKLPNGYGLDSVLDFTLGEKFKKLKFNHLMDITYTGPDYHRYMVKNHPLEYIVYNQWDVISMLELDKVTTDLQISLPVLSEASPFDIFNSMPKKLVNVLFYEYLEDGKIIGNKMPVKVKVDEEEIDILDLTDWIITLPNKYLTEKNGRCVILEIPGLKTNIRLFVCDCDQFSGYPSNLEEANVSKYTTKAEISSIGDIPEEVFKKENINIMFGVVNQMQYCQNMMNFPSLEKLEEEFIKIAKELRVMQ